MGQLVPRSDERRPEKRRQSLDPHRSTRRRDLDLGPDLFSFQRFFVHARGMRDPAANVGEPVAPTRILMVNVPRLMVGVIGGIVARVQGIEIVGGTDAAGMLTAIDKLRPDVVVLGEEGQPTSALLGELRHLHHQLRVVALERDGSSATVHEPGAPPREVSEVSPEMLLDMFRIRH